MYFSHPPLTESDTRQSRQALSSLKGGRQIPCSVINPVTKRWGYVKDVSNSFTIECCSLICSMCSHNPNSSTFQSVTSTLFPRHGLVLFFLDNLFIGSGFVQAQQHTFSG